MRSPLSVQEYRVHRAASLSLRNVPTSSATSSSVFPSLINIVSVYFELCADVIEVELLQVKVLGNRCYLAARTATCFVRS